jgi:hypothetical protein
MTAAHRRAARRELEAAKALFGRRQLRWRFDSIGDLEPVELLCGVVIQVEVKARKRLPKLLTAALEQARRYEPNAIPVAVISEFGGQALAVLPLHAFAHIAGVSPVKVGG